MSGTREDFGQAVRTSGIGGVDGRPPAVAVIGAGFGNEGKGSVVDRLAGPNSIVVRTNGGAGSEHTVATRYGARFEFHHVGAGAFRGAATYLSRYFIHDPMKLDADCIGLRAIGVTPDLFADPAGRLATSLDLILGHMIEQVRREFDPACGVGVDETIQRHDRFLPLTISDDPKMVEKHLAAIRADWIPRRLVELGIDDRMLDRMATSDCDWRRHLANIMIDESYIDRLRSAQTRLEFAAPDVCRRFGDIVFENAHGLLLDAENRRFAPYVSPVRTGLTDVVALAREIGVASLTPHYVTRSYMTRLGPGPLPSERSGMRYPDPTNMDDQKWGDLRFGLLDLDLIGEAIAGDLQAAGPGLALHRMTMTCIDHTGPTPKVILGGQEQTIDIDRLGPILRLGRTGRLQFQAGPTRDDLLAPEDLPRYAP